MVVQATQRITSPTMSPSVCPVKPTSPAIVTTSACPAPSLEVWATPYSFDSGMVHYIQLDTETDLGHGFIGPDEIGGSEGEESGPFSTLRDAQLKWLEKDLSAVDRNKTPWIIAGTFYRILSSCTPLLPKKRETISELTDSCSWSPPLVHQREERERHSLRGLS